MRSLKKSSHGNHVDFLRGTIVYTHSVKTLRREITLTFHGRQESHLSHIDTAFGSRKSKFVFLLAYIRRIHRRRKLDYPFFAVNLIENLGARTARRTTHGKQGIQILRILRGKDRCAFIGYSVQIPYGRPSKSMQHWTILKGPRPAIPYYREASHETNAVGIDAMLPEHPVDEKPAPAIWKAVIENAEQPIKGVRIGYKYLIFQRQTERADRVSALEPLRRILEGSQAVLRRSKRAHLAAAHEHLKLAYR